MRTYTTTPTMYRVLLTPVSEERSVSNPSGHAGTPYGVDVQGNHLSEQLVWSSRCVGWIESPRSPFRQI